MSDKTPTTPVVAAPALSEEQVPETELVVKQSLWTKTKTTLKTHKKPAIAGAALVVLVGASAVLGRKTAPTPEPEPEYFSPEDQEAFDAFVQHESDTTVNPDE